MTPKKNSAAQLIRPDINFSYGPMDFYDASRSTIPSVEHSIPKRSEIMNSESVPTGNEESDNMMRICPNKLNVAVQVAESTMNPTTKSKE